MNKLALALLVVAQTASADTCDDRFMFASNIMRQYQAGENAHLMLAEAGNDEALINIVDDTFNYEVPKLATDKLEQINQFSIKHHKKCQFHNETAPLQRKGEDVAIRT